MRGVVFLSVALLAAPAFADYRLVLVGGASALSTSGEALKLTGSGSFDPDGRTAHLAGTFTTLAPDGAPLRHGVWKSYAFERFQRFGNAAEVGGVLEVRATFVSANGVVEQLKMRFTCLVDRPASFAADEGVSVGDFLEPAGGVVRFAKK